MPNITDPQYWSKLSDESKLKFLQFQADLAADKCHDCGYWVCICGEDF